MRNLLAIRALSVFFSSAICFEVDRIYFGQGLTHVQFYERDQVFFVDTFASRLCSYHPSTEMTYCVFIRYGPVSFAVPVRDHPDEYAVGVGNNVFLIQWNSFENEDRPGFFVLTTVDETFMGYRLNYGTADPIGRLLFETMTNELPNLGTVYSLNANLDKKPLMTGAGSNTSGFAWAHPPPPPRRLRLEPSSSRLELRPRSHLEPASRRSRTPHLPPAQPTFPPPYRFYHDNAFLNQILLFKYDIELLTIGGTPEVIMNFGQYMPHNVPVLPGRIAVDRRGWLWVPLLEGGQVIEIDPFAKIANRYIEIPGRRVGACAFGGDNLDILYVSTIGYAYEFSNQHEQRPPYDPEGGSIFSVKDLGPGVRGWPAPNYILNHELVPGFHRDFYPDFHHGFHHNFHQGFDPGFHHGFHHGFH